MVFVALGASFSVAGQLLFQYRDSIRVIGGALIIVFGLYIAGAAAASALLGRTQQWQIREKPAGYVGSFLVGVTFAIGWTPCVGPILGAILSLAGTAETVGRGVGLLVAYSAGLGRAVPALGAGARHVPAVLQALPAVHPDRRARRRGRCSSWSACSSLTNYYIVLNSWAISLTPEWLLKRL